MKGGKEEWKNMFCAPNATCYHNAVGDLWYKVLGAVWFEPGAQDFQLRLHPKLDPLRKSETTPQTRLDLRCGSAQFGSRPKSRPNCGIPNGVSKASVIDTADVKQVEQW